MITRVWGTADGYDLTFGRVGETDNWQFQGLPIDTGDAQYAVSIWAFDDVWGTGYWGGVLYVNNGVYTLRLVPQRFTLWLRPHTQLIRTAGTSLAFTGRRKKGTAARYAG